MAKYSRGVKTYFGIQSYLATSTALYCN